MWNIRYTTLVFKIEELAGLIILSHDHFDHMDEESLKQLFQQNPGCYYSYRFKNCPSFGGMDARSKGDGSRLVSGVQP